MIAPGTVLNELISNIDLAPTLCDLAGIAVPNLMDGRAPRPTQCTHSPLLSTWSLLIVFTLWRVHCVWCRSLAEAAAHRRTTYAEAAVAHAFHDRIRRRRGTPPLFERPRLATADLCRC
jgi:hypothetical protein